MKKNQKQNKYESIIEFPVEVNKDDNIRFFDQTSLENRLAILSHNLHNGVIQSPEDRIELLRAIIEFLEDKELTVEREVQKKDHVNIVAEGEQFDLFSDFFHVPFPNPMRSNFTFIDLFAGIGGIRLPFSEMGYKCVFSSEWDKYAQKTYLSNYGEMPFGDICKESTKKFIPEKFDLLLAGFPCQAFSIIGKMRGFEDTRGTLFFEVASILKKHRPKAFLLENVKQLITHDKGKTFKTICETLKGLGYYFKWSVLNALDFGLPQKRERVIIVGFLDEELANAFNFDFEKVPYDLKDVLEDDNLVDPSLYASEMIIKKRMERTRGKQLFFPSVWHENKSGNISVLDYACALRTGASYNYLLINGRRRPSSRELLRFQGFPDKFKISVSHGEIRRQTGNSVPVPMIRAVAEKIDELFSQKYKTEDYETSKAERWTQTYYKRVVSH